MNASLQSSATLDRQMEIENLNHRAARLRILSIRATTEAGSGHPTSCASAADIVAALFFKVMRRAQDGSYLDRFILSKGHAAPLLYAAWAEAGAIPEESLLGLRKVDSDLEGHPTPRLPLIDVATGSLGQGLSAGVGMALDAKLLSKSAQRIYVLLGDGECAEGSVWEAAAAAAHYDLGNLCAIVDVNGLGQSGPSLLGHDVSVHAAHWHGFGWNAIPVNGHDMAELLDGFHYAGSSNGRPSVILARTEKGHGIPEIAGKAGYHGRALSPREAEAAIQQLSRGVPNLHPVIPPLRVPLRTTPNREHVSAGEPTYHPGSAPAATRKVFGEALVKIGQSSADVVVLDADVKNSSYTEMFEVFPERLFEMFIAEQNMIGAAMGLSACGRIPFAATFACFLTRAADFIRMAAIGNNNIKLAGSHAGVSIGEDGPSQMGLEDLALFCAQPNFTVFYPSDAVSTWRAVELAARLPGPMYIRTTRPATPVIYSPADRFEPGKSRILRQNDRDMVTIVGAGITLFEALKAHDELSEGGIHTRVIDLFSVQPLDRATIREALRATEGRLVTVEDHHRRGGFGEAICTVAAEEGVEVRARILAVPEIPRSGSPSALLDMYGISARHIVHAVHALL